MLWRILGLGGALLLAACGGEQAAEPQSATGMAVTEQVSESGRLNTWFAERNEERLSFSPVELTLLGRKDQYDQIDQLTDEAVEEFLDWHAATIAQMQQDFDYDALDLEAKTSWDVWIYMYERNRGIHAFTNQDYVFEQMDGLHSFFPTLLINYHKVDTRGDMEAYIARIREVGRALGQELDKARRNAELGTRSPRFAYEIVIDEITKITSGAPFDEDGNDSPVWADVQAKIAALQEAGSLTDTDAASLREQAEAALRQSYLPVYHDIREWLQQDLVNTDPEPRGVWALPDGDNYYQQQLRFNTTTELTAAEIHQIGLDEVDRIWGEMEAIRDQVNFTGDMAEFLQFISSDPQFFYTNDDAGRQRYLDETNKYYDFIRERLPDYFGILPKAGLVVKRVESFREQDGAPAHYFASSPDGANPGTYYVHMSDMGANPTTQMESVAYHEGIPGHHMQIAIGLESESIPEFRRQGNYNAYVEGWALYTEKLALEMGAYENPYSNFGRLSNEMWRAVRLVVDTGMHAMGWSKQQAMDFFAARTITPIEAIEAEINRYLVIPGQATSYKIGMLKIQELRARAQEALGDRFDIREFHDVVLSGGALPLDILDRRINNYIEQNLQI